MEAFDRTVKGRKKKWFYNQENYYNNSHYPDYSEKEILKKLKGNGGLTAYLGTADGNEIEQMIDRGDESAKLIYDAMAYQVAKEIGALSAVLAGNVDGIVLTGGLAYSSILVDKIKEHVNFIGKIFVYPGEDEIEALRDAAIRVLTGKEIPQEYVIED